MIISKNTKPVDLGPEHFSLMGIGEEFWDADLSKISDSLHYKKVIENYIEDIELVIHDGIGLLLEGKPFSGKTSAAVIVAKHVYRYYTPYAGVHLLPLFELHHILISPRIRRFKNSGLLIMDDLGAEKKSESVAELVEEILRHRISGRMPTIITTNLNKTELTKRYGEALICKLDAHFRGVMVGGMDWIDVCSKRTLRKSEK